MNNYQDLTVMPNERLLAARQAAQKKKSHEEIKNETVKAFNETQELLIRLEIKRDALDEQIENLKRKQDNRRKFLNQ